MRYSAFISYSYKDRRWATWLHRALENYRVPKRLQGQPGRFGPLAARMPPAFRDRDELAASADLGKAVEAALRDSATLIVICSPRSAKSRWVNEEIRSFAAMGKADDIYCLIVDGEPHSDDPDKECLPPALMEIREGEPLAADMRPEQDGRNAAKLKILSGVLRIEYDELRQRDAARRQRRLALLATASLIGMVVMTGLTIFAFISRNQARERAITAERTVAFVKSMFEVSDPTEAQGATITAREILDKGAQKIRATLNNEPAVKAELAVTLGEVYGSLGLFNRSRDMLAYSFTIPHKRDDISARQFMAMGDVRVRLGDYEAAEKDYARSLDLEQRLGATRRDLLPRILIGYAGAKSALDDLDASDRYAEQALQLDLETLGPNHPDVARDLEMAGLNAYYRGDMKRARPLIARALVIRSRTEGGNSPSVSDNISTLAAIAYATGDLATAERLYRSRLRIDEKVLGANHPDVGISLNNLARMMLDRRAFDRALPLLQRAVAINDRERDETHDDMVFTFNNLAMAQAGLGQTADAMVNYNKALRAARLHKHRMLGPILADMAQLDCAARDTASGLARLNEAAQAVAAEYPDDPWRSAWVRIVRGQCALAAGHRDEAARLIAEASPIVAARWPADTYYGSMAAAARKAVSLR